LSRFCTDRPSISQIKSVTPLTKPLTQVRNAASSVPARHPMPAFSSTTESSELRIGKNKALPSGTVQLRTATLALQPPGGAGNEQNLPPRNHTGPDCPALQSAVSNSGWAVAGSAKHHCHQAADHSL